MGKFLISFLFVLQALAGETEFTCDWAGKSRVDFTADVKIGQKSIHKVVESPGITYRIYIPDIEEVPMSAIITSIYVDDRIVTQSGTCTAEGK